VQSIACMRFPPPFRRPQGATLDARVCISTSLARVVWKCLVHRYKIWPKFGLAGSWIRRLFSNADKPTLITQLYRWNDPEQGRRFYVLPLHGGAFAWPLLQWKRYNAFCICCWGTCHCQLYRCVWFWQKMLLCRIFIAVNNKNL